ncbi:MAG: hypothetical protein ACYC91_05320 [Solirubrobacteraceae bacterium]
MSQIRALLSFLYDFVIGDDWRIAAGVVIALAITAAIAGGYSSDWWILPVAVALLLAGSVWRVARPSD